MNVTKCKHVWMVVAKKYFEDSIPKGGRVVIYCPICRVEYSTEWTEFKIRRFNVPSHQTCAVEW